MESQIGLLDIPKEVVDGMILKYLDWNDILRFRRVCHATKDIADGYLLVNSIRVPEIEINEKTGKTLAAFLEMGIPTTKLFINNQSGYKFYEDLNLNDAGESKRDFMALHGPRIKHLRVIRLTIWPSGEELNFLNSLVNIKTLKASQLEWGREIDFKQKALKFVKQAPNDLQIFKGAFPKSFECLEKIIIGKDLGNETIHKIMISSRIFINLQKLKYASLPFTWQNDLPDPTTEANIVGSLMYEFDSVFNYTESRPNDLYSEHGQLEMYDFINYHDHIGVWNKERAHAVLPLYWFGSMAFLELCERALKTGLKFKNVSPFWFYARDTNNGRFSGNHLGIPVVSLRGLDPCMMTLDMPNLEKITIPRTSRCAITNQDEKPEWPALKTLNVTVDDWIVNSWYFRGQDELQPQLGYLGTVVGELWRFLFKDVVRPNLANLKLNFEENGRWKDQKIASKIGPRVEDILVACPHLKRIELTNWLGTNKALTKLWDGLRHLEEISLIECSNVGNVTFVGENSERPVFFKLKNLKKLTLMGLEKMPKITDLLFSLVLANMNLKELVLSSAKPIEKVTRNGIKALLNGSFGNSIEKFPFRNWSLDGVSDEEFQKLGMQFRSHKMI